MAERKEPGLPSSRFRSLGSAWGSWSPAKKCKTSRSSTVSGMVLL